MIEAAGSDSPQPRVGLVTFTDDRVNIFSREHELNLKRKHREFRAFLEEEGFHGVDTMERLVGKERRQGGTSNFSDHLV